MVRWRFGSKPGVGPALKIMANDADDPWETPNTDYEKFRFNSEVQELSYFREIVRIPTASSTTVFWPAGTNYSNCIVAVGARILGSGVLIYRARAVERWGYLPIFLLRPKIGDDYLFRDGYMGLVSKFMSNFDQTQGWGWSSGGLTSVFGPPVNGVEAVTTITEIVIAATAFPANDDFVPISGTATSGQKTLRIDTNSGQVRLAKPGFEAAAATSDQLIFGDNKQIIPILAYGTVTVSAGATQRFEIPSIIPAGSFVDIRPYAGGYPMSLSALTFDLYIRARTEPGELVVRNLGPNAKTLSYYILGDPTPTGYGPNNRVLTTNGKFELTRWGASSPPAPGDIIVSSEFRYGSLLGNYGSVNSYSAAADPWWTIFGGAQGLSKNIVPLPNLVNNPIVFTSVEYRGGTTSSWARGDLLMDFSLRYFTEDGWFYYQASNWFVTTTTGLHLTIAWATANFRFRYYVISVPN